MSAEARSISAADFSRAIEDLPLENIYSKASELANSVAHLERSNKQLQEYSDSIRNDETIESSTREEGDKECLEAIRENQVVIKRQHDRIALLRADVERRGGRWHEGDFGEASEVIANGSNQPLNGTRPNDARTTRPTAEDGDDVGMHL